MNAPVSLTELPNQHAARPIVLAFEGYAPEVSHPSHLEQERTVGVRRTLEHLHAGRPGRALYELVRSVQRQAAIEGLGRIDLQPTCPCGGRCQGVPR